MQLIWSVSYTHLDVYKRQALTPEGNMTLVDDIGEEEDQSSQQFITLVTKAAVSYTHLWKGCT